ncbi:hypothetical protein A3Q56_07530 [Intoshia linei]|uniref:Uncharacterized protein n=1 Tax=Intoshia linei TaxID=1819745 RepID=A0A177ARW4_9BILA|nr:hypothetical protein A3Q56_07530 [Intoshia linei]
MNQLSVNINIRKSLKNGAKIDTMDAICLTHQTWCEISSELLISSWKKIINIKQTVFKIADQENTEDNIIQLLNIHDGSLYDKDEVKKWYTDGVSSF